MKKGLKTHIWGPNKKKEKSKQKHRSQVRELLTNTWFLGGDKPVQTQSQFEIFFLPFLLRVALSGHGAVCGLSINVIKPKKFVSNKTHFFDGAQLTEPTKRKFEAF